MKIHLLLFAVICSIGSFANAQVTYTTSVGAVFVQVEVPHFGTAWKDPSGQIWSRYQGDFENVSLQAQYGPKIPKSAATEACKKIGGKLPSEEDFRLLNSYFEHLQLIKDYAPLSDQGRKDLKAVFSDTVDSQGEYRRFWSGTSYTFNMIYRPWSFDSKFLYQYYSNKNADEKLSVRCVLN